MGNLFVRTKESRYSNKNLHNIFLMFKTEILKIFVVLESQFSTNRTQEKSLNDIAL